MKKNFVYLVKGDWSLHISHSLPGNYITPGGMKDGVIIGKPKIVSHCDINLIPIVQIFKLYQVGINLSWLVFHLTISKKVKQIKTDVEV